MIMSKACYLLRHAIAIAVFVLLWPTAVGAAEKPNVILLNVDNHDKWSLGCFGNRFIETPNIDRLFREGVRFDSFYTSGRCTSSRSALMTGRYHARNGALGTGSAWGQTRERVPTIGHVFQRGGYQTAMFGKWHCGDMYPLRPEDRGFDEVVTVHNGSMLHHVMVKKGYDDSPRTGAAFRFRHNGAWKVFEGWRTDIWFDELDRWLSKDRDANKPFFVYLATVTAHGPHRGPEDLRDAYKAKYQRPEWLPLRQRFEAAEKSKRADGRKTQAHPYDHAADIAGLDRNVGRMMAMLKRLGLRENTIVVYMSDGSGSGPASAPKSKQSREFGPSANPMMVRWSKLNVKPGTIRSELVANIDVMATLADLCGIELAPGEKASTDGRSFASLLGVGGTTPWKARSYVRDHQSTGLKEAAAKDVMMIRPLSCTTVSLPDGKEVSWRGGKTHGSVAPETVAAAKAVYDQWLRHVIADFPIGAFGAVGPDTPVVYLDGYPIPGGPASAGRSNYFLLEVLADGRWRVDSNTAERYGAVAGKEKTASAGRLRAFRQQMPDPLPVGYDEVLDGYRVLPKTLAKAFTEI